MSLLLLEISMWTLEEIILVILNLLKQFINDEQLTYVTLVCPENGYSTFECKNIYRLIKSFPEYFVISENLLNSVRGMASSRVPFYSPAKPGGGGIPNLLGFILDWYWTQKKLFPYLGPYGKN